MQRYQSCAQLKRSIKLLESTIKIHSGFPLPIFSTVPSYQVFFDYSFITSEIMFNFLIRLCKQNYASSFDIIVTDPDPFTYFYEKFCFIPAARFDLNDSYNIFGDFVADLPSSSPADAIVYRGDQIIIFSDDLKFIVFATREFEIASFSMFDSNIKVDDTQLFVDVDRIFMNSEEAFVYMSALRNLPFRRDEFMRD